MKASKAIFLLMATLIPCSVHRSPAEDMDFVALAEELILAYRKSAPCIEGKVEREVWIYDKWAPEGICGGTEKSEFVMEMLPFGRFMVKETPRFMRWIGGAAEFLEHHVVSAYDGETVRELLLKSGPLAKALVDHNTVEISSGTDLREKIRSEPWCLPAREFILGSAGLWQCSNCDLFNQLRYGNGGDSTRFSLEDDNRTLVVTMPYGTEVAPSGDEHRKHQVEIIKIDLAKRALVFREMRYRVDPVDGSYVATDRLCVDAFQEVQGQFFPTGGTYENFDLDGKLKKKEFIRFSDLKIVVPKDELFSFQVPSGAYITDKRHGIRFKAWEPAEEK